MNRSSNSSGSVGSALRAWMGFLLLILAHFAVRPLISGRATVDFAVIAILFSAVRMRPGLAAVVGFVTGAALDALAPGTFGAHAMVMTGVAYGASWLKAVFFADHIALTALFVFVAKWTFDIALTLLVGVSGALPMGISLMVALLLWAPLAAALTAMAAVMLLVLFRPLYRPQTL
jgi:rod shape-determining protein MreD